MNLDQARKLKLLEKENARLKRAVAELTLDKPLDRLRTPADLERSGRGKLPFGKLRTLLSPSRRRKCVDHVTRGLQVPERRACRVLSQARTTQRRTRKPSDDEESLTRDIVDLATEYGRYGYRRITALLRASGWRVNHKRVERIRVPV